MFLYEYSSKLMFYIVLSLIYYLNSKLFLDFNEKVNKSNCINIKKIEFRN